MELQTIELAKFSNWDEGLAKFCSNNHLFDCQKQIRFNWKSYQVYQVVCPIMDELKIRKFNHLDPKCCCHNARICEQQFSSNHFLMNTFFWDLSCNKF